MKKKRLRLKDSIRIYIIIFITIFSYLTLFYVKFSQVDIDELNECLQTHNLDYCNKAVG